MSNIITCPQCHEENPESRLSCIKCGANLSDTSSGQSNASSFTYESARVARLMGEYSKLTNIKECREWEDKARAVVSYMSDAIAKTEQFISVEKRRLEQASSKTEKTQAEMGLMQFESFREIIGGQLERLRRTIDTLPKGGDDNKPVSLPRENVTLKKQGYQTTSANLQILRVTVMAIIAFLLWYFFNGK